MAQKGHWGGGPGFKGRTTLKKKHYVASLKESRYQKSWKVGNIKKCTESTPGNNWQCWRKRWLGFVYDPLYSNQRRNQSVVFTHTFLSINIQDCTQHRDTLGGINIFLTWNMIALIDIQSFRLICKGGILRCCVQTECVFWSLQFLFY